MLRAALADPQIRQNAVKALTSVAGGCVAPSCNGKSPGTACMGCGASMCLTHAVFRIKPAGPICVACLLEVWGLADEDAPEETPKKRTRR